MTVEHSSAHARPPDDNLPEASVIRDPDDTTSRLPSTTLHSYAKKPATAQPTTSTTANRMELNNNSKQQRSLQPITPLYIIPDQSVGSEWPISSTSPGSTFMYENDPLEHNKALLSPSTSDTIHSPMALSVSSALNFTKQGLEMPMQTEEESINLANFDMSLFVEGPMQDYLTDLMNGAEGSTLQDLGDDLAALTTPCVKTEPDADNTSKSCDGGVMVSQNTAIDSSSSSAQNGLKDETVSGPTLAQLNDGESVLDRFIPLSCCTTQSRGWSSDGTITAAASNATSTSDLSQTNCNSVISSSSTMPSWEESYSFVNATSGPKMVQMTSLKSRPSSSATLASLQTPARAAQLQAPEVKNEQSAINTGFTASRYDQDPVINPAIGIQNVPAMTSSASVVPGHDQTATNVSLQQLLSANKIALSMPYGAEQEMSTVATAGLQLQADSQRAKKRHLESPDRTSNGSGGSMERKWEEIRSYIDSNVVNSNMGAYMNGNMKFAKDDEQKLAATTAGQGEVNGVMKRIKMEPALSYQDIQQSSRRRNDSGSVRIKQEIDSDFDNSDDDLSDVESNASFSSFKEELLHGSTGDQKDKRHFWQYNTQSKGPKGKRLCKSMQEQDPHCLADFEDPVFQPEVNDVRYKHNGKARKGDGNDITPSPWKLFQIGNELSKLNKKINIIGEQEKPVKSKDGVKSKSRKEKNKYASRACRLKKKAQHEANKVKLFGLENEHHQLMDVLKAVKRNIYEHIKDRPTNLEKVRFTAMIENEIKENLTMKIAGHTADYVNMVLHKVAEGDRSGGILLDRD